MAALEANPIARYFNALHQRRPEEEAELDRSLDQTRLSGGGSMGGGEGGGGDWRDWRTEAKEATSVEIPLPPSGPGLQKGTIEKIFSTFGFIFGYNGSRYFFHFGTCVTKPELLKMGDEVEFLLGPDKKSGRMHAQRVYRQPTPGLSEVLERRIPNPAAAPPPRNPAPWTSHHTPRRGTDEPMSPETTSRLLSQLAVSLQQSLGRRSAVGFVAAVFEEGFLIEQLDHSQLSFATRAAETPELRAGEEVAFDVASHNQGTLSEICSLRRLPPGTLTADFVRGAEQMQGQVVTELCLSSGRTGGTVEVIRAPGDPRPGRRYAFSLLGLRPGVALADLGLGTIVNFVLQAEGSERRAVGISPATPERPWSIGSSDAARKPSQDQGTESPSPPPSLSPECRLPPSLIVSEAGPVIRSYMRAFP